MPTARANGIEIAYETFGSSEDPAIVLVMGLGVQLLGWDERFCGLLADRGFFVVRFDNRDIGLSTKLDDQPVPDLFTLMAGDTSSASYTLDDMAADTAGLMDELGIKSAHLVGASMGGMIAQTLVTLHPERVLSLTSIMSTTGDPSVGQPLESAIPALIAPAPSDREGYVEHIVSMFKLIGSPGYPPDEERLRALIGASFDRSYNPAGFARQLAAILASGDRTQALGQVRAPTLVIHGEDDPLIVRSGGEATTRAIPGAQLKLIPGMGHDLPPALWRELVDAIVANAERAATVGSA